ncbi:MAG TPA: formylglycine-generating enzyme family protein [Candidatus Baltobacteraceae bacterium]|jgi:formylglycine-generating enzyme required for sulfatase activity|nr:formylglycine-generating enzyme family protein [Candidatus Baltobacteraceae bacterium]
MAKAITQDLVLIPGGTFFMGSEDFYPEEAPVHEETVGSFFIDRFPVTNDRFAEFVNDSGYITLAEQPPNPADYPGVPVEALVAGSLVFQGTAGPVDLRDWSQWWAYIPGAQWRYPEGPGSSLDGRGNHPVVHVTYQDAAAYANWAGTQLPTEAEWEFAARGGLDRTAFVWGNEMEPDGKIMANTWHGEFPWKNLLTDGYARTSPVGSFPPNGYGLFDMAGNVWEWTSDWYRDKHVASAEGACCSASLRATIDDSYDPRNPQFHIPRKVLKGGSHLCAPNYCLRFRPAARSPQMIDSSMSHVGFRCIKRTG